MLKKNNVFSRKLYEVLKVQCRLNFWMITSHFAMSVVMRGFLIGEKYEQEDKTDKIHQTGVGTSGNCVAGLFSGISVYNGKYRCHIRAGGNKGTADLQ
jgi:hypothetical protein